MSRQYVTRIFLEQDPDRLSRRCKRGKTSSRAGPSDARYCFTLRCRVRMALLAAAWMPNLGILEPRLGFLA